MFADQEFSSLIEIEQEGLTSNLRWEHATAEPGDNCLLFREPLCKKGSCCLLGEYFLKADHPPFQALKIINAFVQVLKEGLAICRHL